MRQRTSARTRSRSRLDRTKPRRKRRGIPGPFVAFSLIAAFGILFAGCGGVKGPNSPETMDDTTFTADDIEQLANAGASSSSIPATGGEGATASNPDLRPDGGSQGSVPSYPAIDPALKQSYDAIRTVPDVSGNMWKVVNEFLNVRAEARPNAASVGRLNNGETVELAEFVNANWAKIQMADGKTGFVSAKYIARVTSDEDRANAEKAYDNLYYVNFGFVNVRQAPDTRSEKLGEIPGQAFLKPLSVSDGWARVPYAGKEAFVSMQFLAPFRPAFITRQNTFDLPILHYVADQPGMVEAMKVQTAALKKAGKKFMTLRDFYDVLLVQEKRDQRLQPGNVVVTVSGLTPQNIREVTNMLYGAGVRATLFIESKHLGVSGITEKQLLTILANGFDVQSAAHTGDDLRTLTSAQLKLELAQSRVLLQNMTHKTVFAIAYPLGGVNDRVMEAAKENGYLFGLADGPKAPFTRAQFLQLPGVTLTGSVTTDEVVEALK